jgi:hypothetical protein
VGDAQQLLEVMEAALEVQQQTGRVMPLLVDEKIHYSILKMLYSQGWQVWDMANWMQQLPLLYGIWHPYKQVLNLVYRQFYPILSRLEVKKPGRPGVALHCGKKVRYVETLFATLLVASWEVRAELQEVWELAAGEGDTESSASSGTRNSESCSDTVLGGLRSLLLVWLPAVFSLGCSVRDCYWLGGPSGTHKGCHAKDVLAQCLALQVSLQHDWEAKTEYTRTVSCALSVWEPWMDKIPASSFVEEGGAEKAISY